MLLPIFNKQIVLIFAATNGFLDEIPVAAIKRFEDEYLKHLELKYPEVFSEIEEKEKIDETLENKMKDILKKFTESFRYEAD